MHLVFKVSDEIATEEQIHFVGWNLSHIERSDRKDIERKSKCELNDFLVHHEIADVIDLR